VIRSFMEAKFSQLNSINIYILNSVLLIYTQLKLRTGLNVLYHPIFINIKQAQFKFIFGVLQDTFIYFGGLWRKPNPKLS
jgi:hypothetical protein